MAIERTETPFLRSEPTVILAAMDGQRSSGRGWINFSPVLDDPPPPQAALARWFSQRGPSVPHATWTAPKGASRVTLGVEHGLGSKARPELERCGVTLPGDAHVRQDNPRRGLVLEVPATMADAVVLNWLLDAAQALSRVQLDDRWVAAVYPG